ncbi:MAG: hypothetical protein O7G87_18750 [bacterium]|nr:hypothetical protein [bacterium]
MTVRELIDFYLNIRTPGNLLGFDSVFSQDLEALKQAIQNHYGEQKTWLSLPEETELPEAIASQADALLKKFKAWNATEPPE